MIEAHNPHIFNEFYLEYKFIHETTASYYPEMKGKAEKKKIESLPKQLFKSCLILVLYLIGEGTFINCLICVK